MLAGLAPVLRGDEGSKPVRLSVFTSMRVDRPVVTDGWPEIPFSRVALPVYRGTHVEPIMPKYGPQYPEMYLRNGTRGDVLAQFLVLPQGTVDRRSIRILRASEPEFGNAIRAWLPSRRFRPVTVEGCPVAALVQQPHSFEVHGR